MTKYQEIEQLRKTFMYHLRSTYEIIREMTEHSHTEIEEKDKIIFQVNDNEFHITLKFAGEVSLSFNPMMCPSRVFKLMKEFQEKNIIISDCQLTSEIHCKRIM